MSAVGLIAASAGAQVGTVVPITAAGTWTAGQNVSLAGFTNGTTSGNLPSGIYPIVTGGSGSFTVNNAGTTTGTSTGTVSPTPAGGVGPIAGGTSVVIEGTDLGGASAVTFGGTPATTFTVNSGTRITATAPAGTAGPVDVAVTTPFSTSTTTPSSDTYTYLDTPTVTGTTAVASPAGGPTGGGTSVTIAGTGFDNVTSVAFGATPAASFLVNGLNSITAVSPAGSGTVDVTVTTGLGTSATSANDKFAYSGTLAVANGTASYDNSPGTTVPATGTSQTGSTVTIFATGNWTAAIKVQLSGFTNGLTAGLYTIGAQVTGGFTVTFAPALSGSSTGTVLIPQTSTPTLVKATSQSGSTLTLTATGTWYTGQQVYLAAFTNGIATGNYTVTAGGNNSFQVTGTQTASGQGFVIPYQAQSFNAATLVTGGGTINPASVTVTAQPASGTVSVVGTQLIYVPAQATPTTYFQGPNSIWVTSTLTTGTQTATFQICQSAPSVACTTGTMTYVPSVGGFYVGNQLSALGLLVTVVNDTGSGIVVPATAAQGSTFTSITAPPANNLPSTNSGFTVTGIGAYQAITPVPAGISLVPGSLSVTGGDPSTTGKYTATLCTAAMGYVAGICTANFTGNFHATYPYVETSLNVATQVAGGSQLSLPTVSAKWLVTASSGSVSSIETEFRVVTNVLTIGTLALDAFPSDLTSFLTQGLSTPPPAYAAARSALDGQHHRRRPDGAGIHVGQLDHLHGGHGRHLHGDRVRQSGTDLQRDGRHPAVRREPQLDDRRAVRHPGGRHGRGPHGHHHGGQRRPARRHPELHAHGERGPDHHLGHLHHLHGGYSRDLQRDLDGHPCGHLLRDGHPAVRRDPQLDDRRAVRHTGRRHRRDLPDHHHRGQRHPAQRHAELHADRQPGPDHHVGQHQDLHGRHGRHLHGDLDGLPGGHLLRDGIPPDWRHPQLDDRCAVRHPGRRHGRVLPDHHHRGQRHPAQRHPELHAHGEPGPDHHLGQQHHLHDRHGRHLHGDLDGHPGGHLFGDGRPARRRDPQLDDRCALGYPDHRV